MATYHDTDGAEALLASTDLRVTVKGLAGRCIDLIGYRNNLDKAIPLLPGNSTERDRLWHDLEEVTARLRAAVEQLAAHPCEVQADLDHKATVLTTMLRLEFAEALPPDPEVVALSLSLAEDVHRLPPGVGELRTI